MSVDLVLNGIVAVTTALAAAFFLVASRKKVRDSQDHFIQDLQAMAWWNSMGALTAAIAACFILAMWLRDWWWPASLWP